MLDFYGTLVEEDEGPILEICRDIARGSSKSVTPEQLVHEWWEIFGEICVECYGDGFKLERDIEQQTAQTVLDRYETRLPDRSILDNLYEHWKTPPIFPETLSVLDKCDIPICIVSNIDNDAFQAAMEFHGFSFGMTVTSEDLKSYKPRPEMFLKALDMIDMKPEDVLHVGDSLFSDIGGALSLGIPCLWIDNRGRKATAEDPKPDFIAKDLNGLIDILNGKHPGVS